jgi:hypothetical protein
VRTYTPGGERKYAKYPLSLFTSISTLLFHVSMITSLATVKKVVCISRTPPFMNIKDSRYEHWKLDLLNPPEEIARILKEKGGSEATQAHFFAYIGKESEEELIKINVPLFQNASIS